MHKNLLLAVGITILFLGVAVAPLTQSIVIKESNLPISDGNTLYVGGTGPNNYTKIQDAIDDANPGDTVFVYCGNYSGDIEIHKTINLIGEKRYNTIIQNGFYGIKVDANNVLIMNFTLQKNIRACIEMSGKENIIDNCDFVNNERYGIHLELTKNNFVNNCSSTNNGWGGLSLDYSKNNIIQSCYLDGIGCIFSENDMIKNCIVKSDSIGMAWCNNETVNNCLIMDYNGYGIQLQNVSNSIVKSSEIIKAKGILIFQESFGNKIYHNNFIESNDTWSNCEDNQWDNGYPSGGNYWDDYTGEDKDGDGIGDTSYPIPGGDNEDRYPLMEPYILKQPVANFTILNDSEVGFVRFDGSLSYDLDGEIVSYEWDFGDGATGNGKYVVHQYCDCGTFNITLTVTDDNGLKGNLTKSIEVWLANIPPPEIVIDGPSSGKVGIEYNYAFYPIFPESIIIYMWIDWGDGNSTGWIGPYYTDDYVTLTHSWSEKGTYIIQAKCKDLCGEEGDITSLEVTIPRTRPSYLWFLERFPLLERLLGLIRVM